MEKKFAKKVDKYKLSFERENIVIPEVEEQQAASVVMKDAPVYYIAGGNPAD